jgi:outer membrane protein assembly factor BamD
MRKSRNIWLIALAAVAVFTCCAAEKSVAQTSAGNNAKASQAPSQKGQNASAAKNDANNDTDSAEADKVLYEKALKDLQHSRFDLARLSLQTLINTYPDSEYLAKAKLAIADSYYKEGGATGLTQAVAEYQDFITFFPFLDEASYAQMQIAMAHYRRMEKSDRDRSEALEAEAALQSFLQKYPNAELALQAEQRLREVQEVLADGDYRVAAFYYLRRIDKAAAPRLIELVNRYPLYSAADKANWMLGSIFERNEHNDLAATYYTKLVKDYPLSPLTADAKAKLVKFGDPVPQPDPIALARMQKEQQTPRQTGIFMLRPGKLLKSGPDVSTAARFGMPNLTPESDEPTDTLTPGGGLTVVASGTSTGNSSGAGRSVPLAPSEASDAQPSPSAQPPSNPAPGPAAAGDPPAGSSAEASPNGQAANDGAPLNAAGDPPASNQASNMGESSSNKKKKKKAKKQAEAQPQSSSASEP